MDMRIGDGRCRVVIATVRPEIDGGRFAIKRTVGEQVVVEADIFTDGHDAIRALLHWKRAEDPEWTEVPMRPLVDDRWRAEFCVEEVGEYRYTVRAWVDDFQTWRRDMSKRLKSGEADPIEFLIGANLIHHRAHGAAGEDGAVLESFAARLEDPAGADKTEAALDEGLASLMLRYPDRSLEVAYPQELRVTVDPVRARFSAWYELFPRSTAAEAGSHGTFRDCENVLSRVASMGFDVVYLPPVHPIGRTHRKGRNNSLECLPEDVGSPWAIGAEEGGHKAVHPALGTLDDFQRLVEKARGLGLEIALDIALQCSPDHPYVRGHPDWFRTRPDGTVQYAENPPKKYQDIYPFNFECEDWRGLWEELKSIFVFWLGLGVRIFRVDNP
ncbi:MAG: maltotransferase domain-containing protein, partial [Acidobacteriota bacterium]